MNIDYQLLAELSFVEEQEKVSLWISEEDSRLLQE